MKMKIIESEDFSPNVGFETPVVLKAALVEYDGRRYLAYSGKDGSGIPYKNIINFKYYPDRATNLAEALLNRHTVDPSATNETNIKIRGGLVKILNVI